MFAVLVSALCAAPIHLDPTRPVAERVEDLLSKMNLSEKVGQMCLIDGRNYLEREFSRQHAGAILQILGDATLPAYELSLRTRLQIPVLFGIDAIHGHSFWPGATIFPTQLTQAASWDEDLVEEIGAITAREMNNTGVAWAFSPVLCIARDPRWGRTGESYGEDPMLIGRLGSRLVRGLQRHGIAACPKHFAGYSETHGGRDSSEADLSGRKLRSFFLPPFERVLESRPATFMSSYQATDGVVTTANRWLLRDVLKGEWGFGGLVVTDWGTIDDMVNRQNAFPNRSAAAIAAVKAGVDIAMVAPTFHSDVVAAVHSGLLNVSLVDDAVRRVLKVKFDLGLFENRRVPKTKQVVAGTPEHRAVALRAAEESLILLKNDGMLPLAKAPKVIAVLGPNADHAQAQLGDWALGTGQAGRDEQPRELTVTALDGIRQVFPGATVLHRRGAEVDPTEEPNLSAALDIAKIAELVVVVVGDRLQYYGESKSTATLELMGSQIQLLRALVRLKKPFVVDLIASKPLVLPDDIVAAASAIIAQFSPGMLGGTALAEALVGKINPSGKLTISWPLHVGQLPVYYNRIPGQHQTRYADCPGTPRWAFGYGLSYSKFAYAGASINKLKFTKNETITLKFTVTNQGPYDGVEIVQVYVSDLITSVTWPEQELKAFQRVSLKAQEAKQVAITFKSSDCSIVAANGTRLVESGDFELRIGQASDKILIRIQFTIT